MLLTFCFVVLQRHSQQYRMSAQKRPCDPSSSAGAPPEKRRDREGGDAGEGLSTGASNAVETVIKLGGVSNSVRCLIFKCKVDEDFIFMQPMIV